MITTLQLYHSLHSYSKVADVLGISRQRVHQIVRKSGEPKSNRAVKLNPRKEELIVASKLRRLGYVVKHMPYLHNYDLLVNNKIRVEVKRKSYVSYWRGKALFKFNFTHKNFDIAVLLAGSISDPKFYIFTKEQIRKFSVNIRQNYLLNSKYPRINKDAWNFLSFADTRHSDTHTKRRL
mgnify:CR=1 FL=1